MPHRHIIGVEVVLANRAHHHFTGVHSHPHQQGWVAFGSQRIGIPAHLLLHTQGSIQGPLGMVLRSPSVAPHASNAACSARMRSARCGGVYVTGAWEEEPAGARDAAFSPFQTSIL